MWEVRGLKTLKNTKNENRVFPLKNKAENIPAVFSQNRHFLRFYGCFKRDFPVDLQGRKGSILAVGKKVCTRTSSSIAVK